MEKFEIKHMISNIAIEQFIRAKIEIRKKRGIDFLTKSQNTSIIYDNYREVKKLKSYSTSGYRLFLIIDEHDVNNERQIYDYLSE